MYQSGEYAWNSGMFIWRTDVILEEIARQMPELSSQLSLIEETWGTEKQDQTIRKVWPLIKPQTIDFGIMENAEKVAVIPAQDLEWNDVGSWEAIFDLLPEDALGNITNGIEHIALETKDTLVFGEKSPRVVVTIGAEDLIIVDTGDILLVCKRDRAQDVRQVVKKLKDDGRTELI
jgi:mannose-1-phosphate guanylyltransferase